MVKVKTPVFTEFDLDVIKLDRVSYIKLFTWFSHDFRSLNGFFFVNGKGVSCKNQDFINLKFNNSKSFIAEKETQIIG